MYGAYADIPLTVEDILDRGLDLVRGQFDWRILVGRIRRHFCLIASEVA
jgi:hypothetical protein